MDATIDTRAVAGALRDAGYRIVKLCRLPGNTLELHVKPAALKDSDGNCRAQAALAAMGLQSSCKTFAAMPQPILVVRVQMPGGAQ